jgi:hypothetical protein
VIRFGKYGRKESSIVIKFGKYGRNPSWIGSEKISKIRKTIVKWYGKYGRKVNWKVKDFTIQLPFLPYFQNLFTIQLVFIPYFPNLITIKPSFLHLFSFKDDYPWSSLDIPPGLIHLVIVFTDKWAGCFWHLRHRIWYCFDNYFTYFVPVFKYCYSDSRNLWTVE